MQDDGHHGTTEVLLSNWKLYLSMKKVLVNKEDIYKTDDVLSCCVFSVLVFDSLYCMYSFSLLLYLCIITPLLLLLLMDHCTELTHQLARIHDMLMWYSNVCCNIGCAF